METVRWRVSPKLKTSGRALPEVLEVDEEVDISISVQARNRRII
jgi:hypothetical protein